MNGAQVTDEDGNLPRQLLMALGALLAAALVVGGIMSVVALGAARVAGVGETSGATAEPSIYIPAPPSPSARPEVPGQTPGQSDGPSASPDPGRSEKPDKQARRAITVSASPASGSVLQRIYLRGTYRGGNGTTLQVQRLEGGWRDFPVSATVRGGAFETYVQSGQEGRNRFRVVDASTGRASAPVTVTLR